MKGLIGKKVGMTQVFDESGNIVPVTLIEAGPCYVTIIRHPKRDHYKAVQLGFGEAKPKHLSGGQLGHLKKNDLPPLRYLREFRVKSVEDLKEGDQLKVDVFQIVFASPLHNDVIGLYRTFGWHTKPVGTTV